MLHFSLNGANENIGISAEFQFPEVVLCTFVKVCWKVLVGIPVLERMLHPDGPALQRGPQPGGHTELIVIAIKKTMIADNGVLQDRLIKAMRIEGVSDMKAANAFAPRYIEAHNARFARAAANPKELHRPLEAHHDVTSAMCVKSTRKVTNSLDLRYEGHLLILDPAICDDGFDPYSLIHARVDVLDYPDGQLDVKYQGRSLPFRVFNKAQRVTQGDIVANKRIGEVLAHIQTLQEVGKAKTYKQSRRRTAQRDGVIQPTS